MSRIKICSIGVLNDSSVCFRAFRAVVDRDNRIGDRQTTQGLILWLRLSDCLLKDRLRTYDKLIIISSLLSQSAGIVAPP